MAAQLRIETLVSEYKWNCRIMEEARLAQLVQEKKEEEERRIEEEARRKHQWDEEQELLRRADEVRMRRAGNVDSEGGKGPDAGMDASFGGRNEDTADGIVISKVCYF